MSGFGFEDMPATTVATLRRRVPVGGLREFFAMAFERVAQAVAGAGGRVVGPPFAQYHGMPTDTVDVSAGFPVVGTGPVADDEVVVGERPGGRAAVALHVGPYEGLSGTWGALMGWMAEQGVHPGELMWEEYLTAPEGDPAGWRTRVVVPLP